MTKDNKRKLPSTSSSISQSQLPLSYTVLYITATTKSACITHLFGLVNNNSGGEGGAVLELDQIALELGVLDCKQLQ